MKLINCSDLDLVSMSQNFYFLISISLMVLDYLKVVTDMYNIIQVLNHYEFWFLVSGLCWIYQGSCFLRPWFCSHRVRWVMICWLFLFFLYRTLCCDVFLFPLGYSGLGLSMFGCLFDWISSQRYIGVECWISLCNMILLPELHWFIFLFFCLCWTLLRGSLVSIFGIDLDLDSILFYYLCIFN